MIISESHKQVFCHIPKNGESSLRAHFKVLWPHAREYQGRQSVPALNGEMRDLTHITPLEAKILFDDDLIGLECQVIAIIRAPIPRFSSALLQYIRSFRAQHKQFVDAQTVLDIMADTSVPDLCRASRSDMRCIYFRPQSDFLETVPEQARDLIVMDQLSARFPDLAVDNPGGRLPNALRFLAHPIFKKAAAGQQGQGTTGAEADTERSANFCHHRRDCGTEPGFSGRVLCRGSNPLRRTLRSVPMTFSYYLGIRAAVDHWPVAGWGP